MDGLAGGVGGVGIAPSGDIGLNHALFQPAHGTAQDIVANLGFYSQFTKRVSHCANDEQIRMGVNQSHAGNVADWNERQQKPC